MAGHGFTRLQYATIWKLFSTGKMVNKGSLRSSMDSPKNAPQPSKAGPPKPLGPLGPPKSGSLKPDSPKANPRIPRILLPQRLGFLMAAGNLVLALLAASPLGEGLWGNLEQRMALYWLILAANVGSVLCAVGLAIGNPSLAWGGSGSFLGLVFLLQNFWYAVPLALALMACVLAWEMVRPRPAKPDPPPMPPPWAWQPPPWQGYPPPQPPWPGPPQQPQWPGNQDWP